MDEPKRYRVEPSGAGWGQHLVLGPDSKRAVFVGRKRRCVEVAALLDKAWQEGIFEGECRTHAEAAHERG